MKPEEIKKAVELSEKELKDKQVTEVKEVVKRTLTKIEDLKEKREQLVEAHKKELADVDEKLKYLKMDMDDLKEGRLDRIEERQQKDLKAKEISVVIIFKETVKEVPVPYPITIIKEVPLPAPSWPRPITPWFEPYYIQ